MTKTGSFIVHLQIFYLVGFWWDNHSISQDPKHWWDSGGMNFGMVSFMMVEVWDGDSWDRFHSFRTSSHHNPTRMCCTKLPINNSPQTIFVGGSVLMGKELLTELKYAIFKNWLDTRPKMETHEPNVYPTILGGVSRGFWTPFLDRGARSAIFWHLKTGTFCKGF